MTGTLPVFIDAGSNFAGTAIDEDNLVEQLYNAGKKVVHIGDDTWHSLFPGYFEPNLTRPYDSFNVWDLHTVDNGVSQHLFPLLEPGMRDRWDVVIGHYLGVDHAGHRYGPDHPAMADKLKQMDDVFRRIVEKLDEDTLLVVMGDHGMDVKGDHGGESDDEVEAALWMYSKKGIFGRHPAKPVEPPATAKERPVGQIDLVPTLAVLLGMPVPFNNLGQPIEEAFLGRNADFANLAEINRLTAAQIHRYQAKYSQARGLDDSVASTTSQLWEHANNAYGVLAKSKGAGESPKVTAEAYAAYQEENLRICRNLWARFDLVRMGMGILTLLGTFAIIAIYAQGIAGDRASLTPVLLAWGLVGTVTGGAIGAAAGFLLSLPLLQYGSFGAALFGIVSTLLGLWPARQILRLPLPKTFWGGLCTLVTLLLCVGFAANSFTIWEDEQLLFLLNTFGILMLGSSLGQVEQQDRALGATNAISFIVATRLSSLSRLCREEQMPNCRSSYYASATSSTSASWQLGIPVLVALTLPLAIGHFYKRTKNYNGSAVIWIRYALRVGLAMVAFFWALDAADDGDWFMSISKPTLKTTKVLVAQVTLGLAFAAGYATYIMASPLLAVKEEEADAPNPTPSRPLDPSEPNSPVYTPLNPSKQPRKKLIIFGYANTHGTHYFLLPLAWLLALLLLQKPMGQGALALCAISILNLLEILDTNDLRHSPLGPTVLALLGGFYFFKTGHQAALATIQWETAFIPLKTIQYPWSPLFVVLNTYGAQILCAIAVPAIALWKVPPKQPLLLGRMAGAMATHILFYAAIALATVVESAWLRRHLMLYRVFMPRMLMAITTLLLVEVVGVLVAIVGVRWTVVSVGEVFGWPGT
jgi:GPI ethanolamine phosphate transferase 3 subunit O